MMIDLTPADRKLIIEALEWGRREELNGIDYSTYGRSEEEIDESFAEEGQVNRKYDRVIAKVKGEKAKRVKSATQK